jgi:hypothetical protein
LNSSKDSNLVAKLDELEVLGFTNIWHEELTPYTFRMIAITVPGFEGHTLLEVCEDKEGYTCYHYDPDGKFVGEKYVEFKP